ncbi:MAG: MBL fold metallo-hydrolase [Methanobacteriota archaeon]|nr:MAG: MBL fold metallo-hydrolase [Euryarchaeota archaeon]
MHDSFVAVLSSGSCGNSTFVSASETSLLIDAGLSCRELERRLAIYGIEPQQIEGVLLTHEHTDHNRGARRFCKMHGVSLFGTAGTLALTPHEDVNSIVISDRESLAIGSISVRPFPVNHLAAEPVAFSLTLNGAKVSIASDLGCFTERVVREMKCSNLLMVEANYDEEMLRNGNYPGFLKRAIMSDHGHLSNYDAGNLCASTASDASKEIVLLHLSKDNNSSEVAKDAVCDSIGELMPRMSVVPVEHGLHAGPFKL